MEYKFPAALYFVFDKTSATAAVVRAEIRETIWTTELCCQNRNRNRWSDDNKYEGTLCSIKHYTKKTGKVRINVTLRRVHVTIFAMDKQ
jgi:hypothetical protein